MEDHQLEPGVIRGTQNMAALSQAASIKRIADALELMAQTLSELVVNEVQKAIAKERKSD